MSETDTSISINPAPRVVGSTMKKRPRYAQHRLFHAEPTGENSCNAAHRQRLSRSYSTVTSALGVRRQALGVRR